MSRDKPSVLLVQPRVGHWDELRTSPAAPLGPLYAAACVARDFDVTFVDQRLPGWQAKLDEALAARPVLVGFSAFTGPMLRHGLGLARRVRAVSDTVPLVWGGFHPTFFPEESARHALVDYVITGEGEVPLAVLARALAEDQPLADDEPGIGFVDAEGRFHYTPPIIPDWPTIPDPPFAALDLARYLPLWEGRPTLNIQASRGCRFRCRFCYHSLKLGTEKVRQYDVDRFLGWVRDFAVPAGAQSLYLVDDSFFTDREWAFRILDGIGSLGLSTQLQGVEVTTLHRMSDDELEHLQRAGVSRICTGIETGSARIRKRIRKPGKLEDAVPVNRRLAKTDMIFQASWITAFPGETIDDLRETIALCLRLIRENPNFRSTPIYNYTPYPGTDMFQEAREAGHRFPDTLEDWGRFGRWDATSAGAWRRHERRIFRGIYAASLFLDLKSREHTRSRLTQLINRLYRPIAMWRIRNLRFGFFPERHLAQLMLAVRGG